ncbi:hypothetical protein EHQ58_01875 [Leptospira ognonensis]|uniref:Uncharacterized protein n=1 Tax=Leptospira ognonensis TaxID=2484945 RepID=A0A4V3JS28_9LEPT|nr:hypothetical protein [Leptospira ognonensis]TGL63040.1 hypothetical protein EHQ58_01875 [Leptospira ognonensis]
MNFIEQVLKEILEGEQNRYGEVEYKFSDTERTFRIQQVVFYLKTNPKLSLEEEKLLSSCIFWGLYDTPNMVEQFTVSFLPFLFLPAVRNGFSRRFDTDLSFDARISHTYATLKDIQAFGLDSQTWISLALENLAKWPEGEKEEEDYKKLLQTLLLTN